MRSDFIRFFFLVLLVGCGASGAAIDAGDDNGGGGDNACDSCGANQVCDNGACKDIPQSCPCPKESYCDLGSNSCVAGCTADNQCSSGRICDTTHRTCSAGCRADGDCGHGKICTGLMCVAGCRMDSDCNTGGGERCFGTECRVGCHVNMDCPNGQICDGTACRVGCTSDSACGNGQICDDSTKVCRAGCRTSGTAKTCPKENVCNPTSLTCQAGCTADSGCNSGRVCASGQCRAGCRTHTDCSIGQVCDPSTLMCVDGCGVPGQPTTGAITSRCPLGQACQPVNCQVDIGDPCSSFRCQANCNGWTCNADATHKWVCYGPPSNPYDDYCLLPCTSQSQCASGQTCQQFFSDPDFAEYSDDSSGFCDKPCTNDGDCAGAKWGTNSGCTCESGSCVMDINGSNQQCTRLTPTGN